MEFFDALSRGAEAAIASRGVVVINAELIRLIRRSFGLSESDAEEAAQDVIVRILELARQTGAHSLEEIRNPAAYLRRLARNRAIDEVRRRYRTDVDLSEELARALPSHDDEISALLDATADAASVRAAIGTAAKAQDYLVLRVVSAWLDAADDLGESPSSREVASRAHTSHTSVNQALGRFRRYLQQS
jgi:DNA-directed RNA polymerase specialized sigma24 family protein